MKGRKEQNGNFRIQGKNCDVTCYRHPMIAATQVSGKSTRASFGSLTGDRERGRERELTWEIPQQGLARHIVQNGKIKQILYGVM